MIWRKKQQAESLDLFPEPLPCPMIRECYSLLKEMERRPALWTGENTLRSIHVFASGYYHALISLNVCSDTLTPDPFFDWVAEKLGYYESTAGWVNMINAYNCGFSPSEIDWEHFLSFEMSKEEHARSIGCFYELIEEFCGGEQK
jgi:hypothetical protein